MAPMPPLLLIAGADEASRRSLESVLTSAGNRVVSVATAAAVLDEAASRRPDAIILDTNLAGMPDFALCRALRGHPALSRATPIVLTTPGPVLRGNQVAALRAGAWELISAPLDAETLVLRLEAYVQAKLEVDRAGEASLIDGTSGLYNAAGMSRRVEELAALAARRQLPLACAVFRPAPTTNGVNGDRLAAAFKRVSRTSDLVARTRPLEFAVFAPATDESGVQQLVWRIGAAAARELNGGSVTLRAGVSVAGVTDRSRPLDLLARARRALETA